MTNPAILPRVPTPLPIVDRPIRIAVDADVVDVLVPTPMHCDVVTQVLEAGYHVQVQNRRRIGPRHSGLTPDRARLVEARRAPRPRDLEN
ncbi:MAG: hypothetical protein SGJ13_10975 [Actinomycetota bacterium]|nr:hypothetical protein [Actinomycetota bacterium]